MKFFKNLSVVIEKKGAMFGLDARIALAVLAITSLSVGLSQEKQTFEQKTAETKQEMRILEAKFLKHWGKIRFDGVYNVPSGVSVVTTVTNNSTQLPGFTKADAVRRFTGLATPTGVVSDVDKPATLYNHPTNSDSYLLVKAANGFNYKTYRHGGAVSYSYFKNGYFNLASSYIVNYKKDIYFRIIRTLAEITKQDGAAAFATTDTVEPAYSSAAFNMPIFNPKRDALNRGIKFYFVIEHNVDPNSPSDYIVNVVMYSVGPNGKLDTTLPTTLQGIADFAGAAGDDIVNIFSTKDIYLRAKAENLRRLEKIQEKINIIAETTYLDRMSKCAAETTPTASCDMDSDGDFDPEDENKLLDYNPYPKSSLDTSSAKYFNTTTTFNATSITGAETFLDTTLDLPKEYAYDLFGNVLNYQSNVKGRTTAPYTMEVWY